MTGLFCWRKPSASREAFLRKQANQGWMLQPAACDWQFCSFYPDLFMTFPCHSSLSFAISLHAWLSSTCKMQPLTTVTCFCSILPCVYLQCGRDLRGQRRSRTGIARLHHGFLWPCIGCCPTRWQGAQHAAGEHPFVLLPCIQNQSLHAG